MRFVDECLEDHYIFSQKFVANIVHPCVYSSENKNTCVYSSEIEYELLEDHYIFSQKLWHANLSIVATHHEILMQ